MHVFGQTGQFLLAAVPIAALLAAFSWRQSLLYGVTLLLARGGARCVGVSVLQRLAVGRAPSLDQFLNGFDFLQLTALNAFAAVLVMAGHRACRACAAWRR